MKRNRSYKGKMQALLVGFDHEDWLKQVDPDLLRPTSPRPKRKAANKAVHDGTKDVQELEKQILDSQGSLSVNDDDVSVQNQPRSAAPGGAVNPDASNPGMQQMMMMM